MPAAAAGSDMTLCESGTILKGNTFLQATSHWVLLSGNAAIMQADRAETEVRPLAPGQHTLRYTITNGECTASDDITINVSDACLELPDAITPNDDGYNEALVIKGIGFYPDNELEIYNRWGNLVFRQINYRNTWKGENNITGGTLPEGTYFVIFRTENENRILRGYVDIRNHQ
jgi:gliding motility-associated-like protein